MILDLITSGPRKTELFVFGCNIFAYFKLFRRTVFNSKLLDYLWLKKKISTVHHITPAANFVGNHFICSSFV